LPDYLNEHLAQQQEFLDASRRAGSRARKRSRFFHREVNRLVVAQVAPDSRVIDVGCADGSLLASCSIQQAAGIDIDAEALGRSANHLTEVEWIPEPVESIEVAPLESPDYVVLSMVLDEVYDAQPVLEQVHGWCAPDTRVVVVTYSRLWQPLLRLAEILRLKVKKPHESYLPRQEVSNLLELSGFEITKEQDGILIPLWIPLISRFVNRWLAPLPLLRALCLIRVTVARPMRVRPGGVDSVSIVIAARNEAGHIRELVDRIPQLAPRQEVIFVEGGSTDDTWDRIQEEVGRPSQRIGERVLALKQSGKGKGDAVRTGFAAATGDILLILDADISVPPEELPRFVEALGSDACEFANGSRLVYPMEAKAMRFLNILGNKFFGALFTYLLGQPVRDTLCGTKVLWRSDYERIAANRARLGEFDPFGDFDLLFGASALGLRIRDIPVHYKERTYGETNISRFRHGVMLIKMASIAATKIKFVG
jgi:2-polyprenyl-3-methyl-5-hydroxy-6-metoxy-1,4-benzoquinol methylase